MTKKELLEEINGLERLLFKIQNNKKYTNCFRNQILDKIEFKKYQIWKLEQKENEQDKN